MFNAAEFINSLNMHSIRLGLDAAKELARRAGDPQNDLRFIHIAGTNGKGSVSAMLERALRETGMRTGLYTSPHLIDVRERFRINGKAVEETLFNRTGSELAALGGGEFSYFEYTTILAMMIFKAAKCDVVIWETGLGGRLDATNIVTPELTVITNIALDHMNHLGDTVDKIAAEKAGILKPGVPLIHGKLPPAARKVICDRAAGLGVSVVPCREAVPEKYSLSTVGETVLQNFVYDNREIALALPGRMQRENFRIVYEALNILAPSWKFDLDTAIAALARVRWPGRFQKINDRIILDGGHNPDGTAALAEALEERFPGEKFTTVYAAFADKNARECVENLAKFTEYFIFSTPIPGGGGRAAFDAAELIGFAAACGVDAGGNPDPEAALADALAGSERRVIISGSLYLAGLILQNHCPISEVIDL